MVVGDLRRRRASVRAHWCGRFGHRRIHTESSQTAAEEDALPRRAGVGRPGTDGGAVAVQRREVNLRDERGHGQLSRSLLSVGGELQRQAELRTGGDVTPQASSQQTRHRTCLGGDFLGVLGLAVGLAGSSQPLVECHRTPDAQSPCTEPHSTTGEGHAGCRTRRRATSFSRCTGCRTETSTVWPPQG